MGYIVTLDFFVDRFRLYLKKFVILFGDVSETIDHADRVRYLREYKRGVEL